VYFAHKLYGFLLSFYYILMYKTAVYTLVNGRIMHFR